MQLMPRTAASLARRMGRGDDYDIADPAFNIEAGTTYLAYLLELFEGDVKLALAGYNAGPMRVRRWVRHGRPIATQVRRYVDNVLAARERFARRDLTPAPPPPADDGLDQDGLRALLREKESLYGQRPDEPLPGDRLSPPGV
jgi:soluble lytic murein transglycosylase-like protein